MAQAPWWFTPVVTFLAALVGGTVSLVTTWLTQRYTLQSQLELRKADAKTAADAALKSERERRYLTVVQGIESLYDSNIEPSRKAEFLKATREIWLLGDQALVITLSKFISELAPQTGRGNAEQILGEVVLEMRRGLDLPSDRLTSDHFPLAKIRQHGPGLLASSQPDTIRRVD